MNQEKKYEFFLQGTSWDPVPASLRLILKADNACFFVYFLKIWADFKHKKEFTKSQAAMAIEYGCSELSIKAKLRFLKKKGFIESRTVQGVNYYNVNIDFVRNEMLKKAKDFTEQKKKLKNKIKEAYEEDAKEEELRQLYELEKLNELI